MNNTVGIIINRLSIGFLFAFIYQIVVAIATSILSIPLTGNISDLFLGLEKANSEGVLLITWWIISTVIITGISLLIVKNKKFFSPYRKEENINIPPKISVVTAIVIGAIISVMFFLTDTIIGLVIPQNTAADVQAIYESATEGNFIPFYLGVIFSLVTGFIIVGVASKISKVSEITKEFGVSDLTRISKILSKTKSERTTLSDTIGLRPGELVYIGERKVEKIRIDIIEYDKENIFEEKDITIEKCLESKVKSNVSWINVIGIHDPEIIKKFGDVMELHALHQANIMNTELRPSIETSEEYIFLMLKMPHFNEEKGKIDLEQISFVLSKDHIVSFQEIEQDFFEQIRKRLRDNIGTIRQRKSDYLTYALLDAVVDSYFLVLEKISDISEGLEDELMTNPTPKTLQSLQLLKRQMILLRKSIWPAREVLDNLQRSASELIQEETKTYLRDSYNHIVQVIDTIEGLRDVVGGMLDTYLSSVSNKMNEIMKTLTIIASIFIPITFVAGVYGMNFQYMPELSSPASYPLVLISMSVIAFALYGYFRKKKWV